MFMFGKRENRFQLRLIQFGFRNFIELFLDGSIYINDFYFARLYDGFEDKPRFLGIDVGG